MLRPARLDREKNNMGIEDEVCEALIEGQNSFRQFRRRAPRWTAVTPWVFATFFFCTTCILGVGHVRKHRVWQGGSFEEGFATDFVSHSPDIPLNVIKKRFTNDLLFNSTSRSLYLQPLDKDESLYVGEPSPALDTAWHKLLHAQYMELKAAEVNQIPPSHRARVWYDQGEHNFMEFAVFHNLHCLNEIRVALDGRNHQPSSWNGDQGMMRRKREEWVHEGRAHLDYCVDQIRQALMCHADLTPVPIMPVEGLPGTIIGNGEAHTCRDFDAIWAWVEERGKKMRAWGDGSI